MDILSSSVINTVKRNAAAKNNFKSLINKTWMIGFGNDSYLKGTKIRFARIEKVCQVYIKNDKI